MYGYIFRRSMVSSLFPACPNGQHTCPDGECIMSEWLCDGEPDCSDDSDEANCRKWINANVSLFGISYIPDQVITMYILTKIQI